MQTENLEERLHQQLGAFSYHQLIFENHTWIQTLTIKYIPSVPD
jgi:hypothetical protein